KKHSTTLQRSRDAPSARIAFLPPRGLRRLLLGDIEPVALTVQTFSPSSRQLFFLVATTFRFERRRHPGGSAPEATRSCPASKQGAWNGNDHRGDPRRV